MIRVDVFEKLSEDHKFNFGDKAKQKIYDIMKDYAETRYINSEPLFTCLILKYYCKVNEEILKGYNDYLINSEYFEEFTHSTIRVTVSDYDQFGKLRMFREFLERYEGEI